ncbi:MAG TPA: hypothetical protein GXZ93_00480 [Actinobacteria bacterium]|jgi:hypothetical protein|nr:hypothetical protein [Actinomycetota bacterium]
MQINKQKTKVRIKTDSAVIIGYVHHMADGRLSDYFTAQVDKFIPVTDALVYPLNYPTDDKEDLQKRDVVFVNTDRIEIVEYF